MIAVGPPLFLLVLDEVLSRRRRSPLLLGVALGAIATMQLLIAEEPLAIAAIFAAVLVVTLALQRRSAVPQASPRLAEALVWATLTFVVLAAVPLSVQFFGAQRIHGAVQNVDTFSTDLLNLVLPTRFQLISPHAATLISDRFSGLTHEANAYVGLPLLLLLVAYCARHWDDVTTRIAAIVAAVAFILTLGPHLHIGAVSTGWPLPWLAASGIPLVEDILPSRMAVVGWLSTAFLVTLAVDAASRGGWRRTVPRLGAIAISLIAVLPAPLQSSTTNVPAFFRNWSSEGIPGGSVVMVAPFFRDGAGADPMIWSAAAGIEFSMPEAYAYIPQADGKPGYGPPATQLSDVMEAIQDKGVTVITGGEVRAQIARDLKAKDIRDVIVGPMEHHQQMVEFFTNLFGRPPEHTDGVDLWRDVDRNRVSGP